MIITIDGPIATGKSTLARALAHEMGYIFFDTGAMYRCLTYSIMKNKVDHKNDEALAALIKNFKFEIKIYKGDRRYFVQGEDVTDRIRMPDVTAFVSEIAALSLVRERLREIQRNFAVGVNAVFEGRDMGSVVFPEAEVKVFLTGRPEVRAKRRFDELKAKFPNDTKDLTPDQVMAQINERDRVDSTRAISPLTQPKDAFVIDTSDLTVDEIVLKILEYKDSLKSHPKVVPLP